jgi:hypothetical protein
MSFERILESSENYTNLYIKTSNQLLLDLKLEGDLVEFKIKYLLKEFAIEIINKLNQFNLKPDNLEAKITLNDLINKQLNFLDKKHYLDKNIRLFIDAINLDKRIILDGKINV